MNYCQVVDKQQIEGSLLDAYIWVEHETLQGQMLSFDRSHLNDW